MLSFPYEAKVINLYRGVCISFTMGFNPTKELEKIRNNLQNKGYIKAIPSDIFRQETMLVLGTNNANKANKWIRFFLDAGLIETGEETVFDSETGSRRVCWVNFKNNGENVDEEKNHQI